MDSPSSNAPERRRAPAVTAVRLLVTSLAVAVAASVGTFAAPTRVAAAWATDTFSSASENELVALTNRSRVAAGKAGLDVDARLTDLARGRSRDMISRDYFSHSIPPSGRKVFSVMQDEAYCFVVAGENIGWNNFPDDVATESIHRMFLDSSGHRANIVGDAWDAVGIGAYKGPGGRKMWTVLFADRCGSLPAASSTPSSTPSATPRPAPGRRAGLATVAADLVARLAARLPIVRAVRIE